MIVTINNGVYGVPFYPQQSMYIVTFYDLIIIHFYFRPPDKAHKYDDGIFSIDILKDNSFK